MVKLKAALKKVRVKLRVHFRFLKCTLRNLRVKLRVGFKSEGKSEGCPVSGGALGADGGGGCSTPFE